MKLNQIAKQPQLTMITIDDEDTIKEYGEAVEFYTWDRQPLDVFLKLANRDTADATGMLDDIRKMILDEKGNQLITDKETIPTPLLMRCITAVVNALGK